MYSVIVLTRNEGVNLLSLQHSLQKCDDWIVVDSGSTDGTTEIAQSLGMRVFCNPFTGFGTQRNWALDNTEPKHPWVLFLDADERGKPSFEDEIISVLGSADQAVAGYYICFRTIMNGRWLKRSDSFPKWQLRLVRMGQARFIDHGHGQKEGVCQGELRYITNPCDHHPFSKGWDDWFDKHNRYSTQEAKQRLNLRADWKKCFSKHGSIRNAAIKGTVAKNRLWPFLRFCYEYGLKGGFTEGLEGLHYCAAMMSYEWMIQIKMRALEKCQQQKTTG